VRTSTWWFPKRKYGLHFYPFSGFGTYPFRTTLRLLLPDETNIPGVVYGGDRTLRVKYSGMS
jgi:hypothetical protein